MKDPRTLTKQEISDLAKQRAKTIRHETQKKKMRETNQAVRETIRGGPARPKRKNYETPPHVRRAEVAGRVAAHRAKKAGKSEAEQRAAYDKSYAKSLAKHTPEEQQQPEEEFVRKPRDDGMAICGAKRTGFLKDGTKKGPCGLAAGWGTEHIGYGRCKWHGGAAPNGIKAAETEQLASDMIRREIDFYGSALDIDPIEALAQEVRRTSGHIAWLGEEIKKLTTYSEDTPQGRKEQLLIEMYREERKHLVMVCTKAIGAGIAERQVRLAEDQGRILATVIRDILWDKALLLTPEQRQLSGDIVRKHLLALDTAMNQMSNNLPAVAAESVLDTTATG